MTTRLSVCLPVHNVQATLERNVTRMLDVLTELTAEFELVIVDNGSTDETADAAHELTVRYPQVRVTTNRAQLGHPASLRHVLARMTGDVLIFPEKEGSIDAAALSTLWSAAAKHDAVFMKRPEGPARRRMLTGRMMARTRWRKSSHRRRYLGGLVSTDAVQAGEPAPLQLVRREVLERLGWIPLERGELMAAMATRGYHWIVVGSERPEAAEMHSGVRVRRRERGSRGSGQPKSDAPRRPNYLDQIKRFALGE